MQCDRHAKGQRVATDEHVALVREISGVSGEGGPDVRGFDRTFNFEIRYPDSVDDGLD